MSERRSCVECGIVFQVNPSGSYPDRCRECREENWITPSAIAPHEQPAPVTQESPPWWLIDSEVAGCPILVVAAKESLQAARQAHPGVPVFIGPEVETLAAFPPGEGRDRLVRAAVAAKWILGGWVVPPPAAPAGEAGEVRP